MSDEQLQTILCIVHGRVQGVGFRYWTNSRAQELGLHGTVRNLGDGTVEAVASGSPEQLEAFVKELHSGPIAAKVKNVDVSTVDFQVFTEFQILRS